MIANNITPYKPTHPGEVIREEIEYRGITQRRLSVQVGIVQPIINELLNGQRPITSRYALIFEATLGIEAEMLMRMQMRYDMQTIRESKVWGERLKQLSKRELIP
jgi:addiction module HigA family antidote